MQLAALRLCNFQSFGPAPTELIPDKLTYLIGPNGSGKTAVLQALCRLFASEPQLRRIIHSDFHVPHNEPDQPDERKLWIEVDFVFPELEDEADSSTVPPHFAHMRLVHGDELPRVRFRLTASMGPDGDIEESLAYVLETHANGEPLATKLVPRSDRNYIHVHYLPARRDPADHIAHGASALLGRLFRAVNWENERKDIEDLGAQISASLATNPSVHAIGKTLKAAWASFHKGAFVANPRVTFVASEIEALLRHVSISFSPGHDGPDVSFSRLSDGQKSLLYLSLVLASQAIGRRALTGEDESFDVGRLRPPVFTIIALEEPENSLSPHYLGRIIHALDAMVCNGDAQALLATHAPALLRRVDPERIRYLRLTEDRTTCVTRIPLPPEGDIAHKFVREAIQAFPEVYFSRLVILVEGDSEEIILSRLLQAKRVLPDDSAVSIAPLGGRHVNHFWRLLTGLQIPYLTLLDLDVARYQGGWGRIKYVNDQLGQHRPQDQLRFKARIPKWNSTKYSVRSFNAPFRALERRGIFFSYPMDIDFAMLLSFPQAYGSENETPSASTISAVLGKRHGDESQYREDELELFDSYHRLFKLGSKPAAHFSALARIVDKELLSSMPGSLERLVDTVALKLADLPE